MRKFLFVIVFLFAIINIISSCNKDDDDLEKGSENKTTERTLYDTIVVDSIVHDTIVVDSIVYDTIYEDSIVYDTIYKDSIVYDTIYKDSIVHDTIYVDSIVHDTIVLYGFSVLGNSISTYKGYVPDGYPCHYSSSNMKVQETWWMRFADLSGIPLNSNASWSGSTVSSALKSTDSWFFSDRRINDLSRNGIPRYIFILGGTNDWRSNKCALGTSYTTLNKATFSGAYSLLLNKLKKRYPYTDIICMSILPRTQGFYTPNDQGWTIHDGDSCIREIATMYGAQFIDMSGCGIDQPLTDYTEDGLHPNAAGMKLVAEYLYQNFIKSY